VVSTFQKRRARAGFARLRSVLTQRFFFPQHRGPMRWSRCNLKPHSSNNVPGNPTMPFICSSGPGVRPVPTQWPFCGKKKRYTFFGAALAPSWEYLLPEKSRARQITLERAPTVSPKSTYRCPFSTSKRSAGSEAGGWFQAFEARARRHRANRQIMATTSGRFFRGRVFAACRERPCAQRRPLIRCAGVADAESVVFRSRLPRWERASPASCFNVCRLSRPPLSHLVLIRLVSLHPQTSGHRWVVEHELHAIVSLHKCPIPADKWPPPGLRRCIRNLQQFPWRQFGQFCRGRPAQIFPEEGDGFRATEKKNSMAAGKVHAPILYYCCNLIGGKWTTARLLRICNQGWPGGHDCYFLRVSRYCQHGFRQFRWVYRIRFFRMSRATFAF